MTYNIADPPRFEIKEIQTFIKENYDLTVKIKSLVSDIGQNFHLVDRLGKEFILKIANNSESAAMLEAQNAVLDYLRHKNLNFHVPIVVENLKGEKITTLFENREMTADEKDYVEWDGNDSYGKPVPSGIYIYELNTNKRNYSRKMVLTK